MRKIIAAEFMTIDSVIQNEEADGDGIKYGGWFFGYADEATGAMVQERFGEPVDLLLGRKSFDIWEPYWPTHSHFWPNVVTATKYVASNTHRKRLAADRLPGRRPRGKGLRIEANRRPDIHVFGSADMLQTLFKADLIDVLELMIFPITLGTGKRLFRTAPPPPPLR